MWEVRSWSISGVLTGYRVMRGAGWNAEVAEGFAGDCYIPGSFEKAKQDACALAVRLNRSLIRAA